MELTCGMCSSPRQRGHRFCPSCGAGLDEPADEAAGRRPPVARRQPETERKQISVLFADLCGSTAQVASIDPEEARQLLDRALRLMSDAVEAYGGTVSQLLGDGLLALFGAPLAQEDHALRACLAALAIQRRSAELRRAGEDPDRPMQIRVGIASGEVIVGSVSEYLSSHYRADGTTVHLAARLEQLARPGSVLLDGATHRLVQDQVEVTALGATVIRGFGTEVELFELVLGPNRSAAAPLAWRRRWGPLVGRAQLLANLDAIAEKVLAGQLRVVGLRGEAGVGKSRLIAEFCAGTPARGFRTHAIGARAYTGHLAYSLIRDLIRALMEVPAAGDAQGERQLLHERVAGWSGARRRHAEAVTDLLELGPPGEAWLALSPAQRRRRIGEALIWLIAEQAAASALLLVIEDIALADRDSQRLLETLVRRMTGLPVLILTSYRPSFEHRWHASDAFVEQPVAALQPADMQQMARAMLGEHASLERVLPKLIARAGGNPFFFEQMAVTLIDDGTLLGTPGAYRCSAAQREPGVPASVAALIGARVDRLPAGAKASLQAAAVAGEPIADTLIAAMRELPVREVRAQLLHCVSSGLLGAPLSAQAPDFSFRHGLVQEVVAAALTRPRRRQLHHRAFLALRERSGEAAGDGAAMLAHHALLGEAWADAAAQALAALPRAIARSADREALRLFELGLQATQQLGPGDEKLQLELGLRAQAFGALLTLGRLDALLENLERAEAIARQLGDERRRVTVLLQLANLHWMRGSPRRGLAAAGDARDAADAVGSRSLQLAALHACMMLNHALGRYGEVVEDGRRVEREFARELEARRLMPGWAVIASVSIRTFLASALHRQGEFGAAQQSCDLAYEDLAAHEHAFSRVLLDHAQCALWTDEARYAEAAALARDSLERCSANDVLTMHACMMAALGKAQARDGRAAEAIELLGRGLADKAYEGGGRYAEFFLRAAHGAALAESGRHDEAIESVVAARGCAAAHEHRGQEAEALYLHGDILLAAGRGPAALEAFEQALEIGRECAMHLLTARAVALIERLRTGSTTTSDR